MVGSLLMRPNVVVGGGIVGLAVARALQDLRPEQPVVVLEKETELADHQTGHNSGVIHSGLYYAPGSLRARLAVSGAGALKEFCSARDIAYDVPGELVVATSPRENAQLAPSPAATACLPIGEHIARELYAD